MNRLSFAVVALALGVSLLSAPAAQPAIEPVADFTAAAAVGPYGDPQWYPLRQDAKLRCVFSQCIGTPEYAALDLASATNTKGEPVHAAGKGIFHVGDTGRGCFSDDRTSTRGNWAWIDHGGGVVSRYHHLNTVVATEGQVVDPSDLIATMGQSGSKCGDTYYLHFETRRGGVNGQIFPADPAPLAICSPTKKVYPNALGETAWDDLARDTIVPGGTADCYTEPVTPEPPASTSTTRGATWARLNWATVSSGVTGVAVHRQEYQVAAAKWGLDTYRYLGRGAATDPALATTQWNDVTSVRRYRARVAFRNAQGHSEWTPWRELIGPPEVPRHNSLYPQAGKTNVRYAWKKSYENGTPVTEYQVARRHMIRGVWSAWSYYETNSPDIYYIRWDGLVSGRTYGMRVRAASAAGYSAWKSVSTITTLK